METILSSAALPISPVVCAGCGCLCDDIELVNEPGLLVCKQACRQGIAYLQQAVNCQNRCWQKGQLVTREQAIEGIARVLSTAKSAGILGLSLASVEDVTASVHLAESLNAWLCPWPADPIRFWGIEAPELSLSRAETEDDADLILFVGFDRGVDAVQPRFRERHFSRGAGQTRTQLQIMWPVQERMKHILELRLHDEKDEPLPDHLNQLSTAMKQARCVQIYVVAQLALDDAPYIAQWQHWAAHQRKYRRVGLSLLGSTGKARTTTETLTWLTGFPGPLRFENKQVQYLPSLGEADQLIQRKALDVILWIGIDPNHFWKSIAQKFPHVDRSSFTEIVVANTSDSQQVEYAIEVPLLSPLDDAHVVRGDGIMLRLAGQSKGQHSQTAVVLKSIYQKLKPCHND